MHAPECKLLCVHIHSDELDWRYLCSDTLNVLSTNRSVSAYPDIYGCPLVLLKALTYLR